MLLKLSPKERAGLEISSTIIDVAIGDQTLNVEVGLGLNGRFYIWDTSRPKNEQRDLLEFLNEQTIEDPLHAINFLVPLANRYSIDSVRNNASLQLQKALGKRFLEWMNKPDNIEKARELVTRAL